MRPFLSGAALGAVAMLIACWQSPTVTLQRIGMFAVILAATAGFLWALAALADYGVRTLGVYSELVRFAWDRRKAARARKSAAQ